jgi:hypothetical protein
MNSVSVKAQKNGCLVLWLQERANKAGDFFVATHYPDGRWSKWVSVMHCWETPSDMWRLATATNMSSRPCDIFIDLDPEEGELVVPPSRMWDVVSKLKVYGFYPFEVYWTGSRGYHIHIVEPELCLVEKRIHRERIRKHLMERVGADLMLSSEKHLIAIPNVNHWKSGNPKKLIYKYPKCH